MNQNENLTNAKIVGNQGVLDIKLPLHTKFKDSKFLLVIQADTLEFTRLMVYPINERKIIKLFFIVSKKNIGNVKDLPHDFKDFQIIHNSGLILKNKKFLGEIYFDLRFTDSKYKYLKTYLDNNRNVFEKIELNEITLKS